jgi:hypothetical protein
MKEHVYEDPTGGGDDIIMQAPDWVTPPQSIDTRDASGYDETFQLVATKDDSPDPVRMQ